MEWITDPESWIALATLTALEIVLGIDNIVFISILAGRLPEAQRPLARRLGLGAALVTRLGLLFAISWVMRLEAPWVHLLGRPLSGRDLILIAGGLFLIAKATLEIHHKLEEAGRPPVAMPRHAGLGAIIAQIALLDLVFSLDSVITAVGMVRHLAIMVTAVVLAMLAMIAFVGVVARFVERHPTFKVLALSFLLLIGVALIGEGLSLEIPKGYIYFAMGFSLFVEILNLKIHRSRPRIATASGTPGDLARQDRHE